MDENLNMSLNEYALGSALALAIKTISAAATALAINAKIKRQFGLLCGADSLPHLIAALGPVQHALRPGLLFLYIAGWISWVSRSYLVAIRGEKKPELINGDFVIDDTDIS